jgi:antitoxin component YwqK of YwqJK toxin-antitoxin module
MKLYTLILISVIAVFFSCKPKPTEKFLYYTSGEVSRKHIEIDGKKEGKMTEYYKDGTVKSERMFENDVEVGTSVFFYPNGAVKERIYLVGGKLNGGDTIFYEDGKPQFMRNWNHGILDGYIRKWDTIGNVTYEARYANDKLVEVKGQSVHPDSLIAK